MNLTQVFNLIMQPLPKTFSIEELEATLGPRAVRAHQDDVLGMLRLQLAATLLRAQVQENIEHAPPVTGEAEDLLMGCDIHAANSKELYKEAESEREWHQHAQWPCFFAQIYLKLKAREAVISLTREHVRSVSSVIQGFTHHEECRAAYCDDDDCDCPFLHDQDAEDPISDEKAHNKECTCGIHKLYKGIEGISATLEGR